MDELEYPTTRSDTREVRDAVFELRAEIEKIDHRLDGLIGENGKDLASYLREELYGIGANSNSLKVLPGIAGLLVWVCGLLGVNAMLLGALVYRMW